MSKIKIKSQSGMTTLRTKETTVQITEIEPGICSANIFTSALERSTRILVSIFSIVTAAHSYRGDDPDGFILNLCAFQEISS